MVSLITEVLTICCEEGTDLGISVGGLFLFLGFLCYYHIIYFSGSYFFKFSLLYTIMDFKVNNNHVCTYVFDALGSYKNIYDGYVFLFSYTFFMH